MSPIYNQENNTSICPTGWKLPSASNFSELIEYNQEESSVETSNNIRSYPNNYGFAGFVVSSKGVIDFDNYGRDHNGRKNIGYPAGRYWANETGSGYNMNFHYRIELGESDVYVTNGCHG